MKKLSQKWLDQAMKNQNYEKGLPQESRKFVSEAGHIDVFKFNDSSEIVIGHGGIWTGEEYKDIISNKGGIS